LYVDASFTSMPQVVNKSDMFWLDPYTCAEANLFHSITCAQNEFKFMSSLNTLGYIEFDILCDLKCLERNFLHILNFHTCLIIHITLLASIIAKDNIWCINFILALIWNILLGYNIMTK
jgi:hypothetical protein